MRRRARRALVWLVLPLALTGCGGKKKSTSGPTSPEELAFLLEHNARFNDGRTVRWPTLPIRVFLNNIARGDEVTEWTGATGGKVTFTFVGSGSQADISFSFGTGDDICGATTIEFDTGTGAILLADVRVVEAVFRGPQCVRTIPHEVGHAIGFLDHTADGGLMDIDGGDGRITEPVMTMFRNLYSLAPGTVIGTPERLRTALQRSGGRSVITIVDPVRR